MSLKTIKTWQKCPKSASTRVINTLNAFKCNSCNKNCTSQKNDKNAVLCMDNGTATFFCISCWDEEEWECQNCGSIPDDSQVIGCETCGQWFHQDCPYYIDTKDGFHCDSCQTSNVSTLKETIFDKSAALKLSINRTNEWKKKCDELQNDKVSLEGRLSGIVQKHSGKIIEFAQKMNNIKKAHFAVTNGLKEEIKNVRSSHNELRTSKNLYRKELKKLIAENKVHIGQKRKLTDENRFLSEEIRKKIVENDSLKSHSAKYASQTHDYLRMVETMNHFIKRQKMEWSYSPPVRLHANDDNLWKLYQCKVRKVNGKDVFGADKIVRSNTIEPLLVHSLKEILQIASKIHANKN